MAKLLRRPVAAGPWWRMARMARMALTAQAALTALTALLALWLMMAAPALRAQGVLPVPALSARVIDQTGTLDAAALGALEAKLAAFEAQAGPQIVLLIVATTAPEDIAVKTSARYLTWKAFTASRVVLPYFPSTTNFKPNSSFRNI